MQIDILSLFPEYFEGPFKVSILKKAQEKGVINIDLINIRDFAEGRRKKVDDRPYGGGPGMILMPGPITKAIRSVRKESTHVIYLSPQGKLLDVETCRRLAVYPHLVLICGHYKGIDQRVVEQVDEEISIGNYILTNGCLASIVVVDAVARFIPGILGNEDSLLDESFQEDGVCEGPCYTRPEIFEGKCVPKVLLSGNHAETQKWKEKVRKKQKDMPWAK
ncbi:MAG: tRNA (guanosine(37)-N1)-methyltransferase TrmD [Chlamydiales bacterium]|jgi:tRNA (guanine37-N1)-methyltransferase|nr:tRNA (guanosine(37)-N1)-methyltransferase TrmD [Chlamydiales bacterium]